MITSDKVKEELSRTDQEYEYDSEVNDFVDWLLEERRLRVLEGNTNGDV